MAEDEKKQHDSDGDREPREKPEPIDLEPVAPEPRDDADDARARPVGQADDREASDPATDRGSVPLEEQFTCPNCNAVMPDEDSLVCLRCGFDIKTLGVKRTKIEKPADEDEDEEDEAGEEEVETEKPLCQPGRGDQWLPMVIGGLAAALLAAGYLAGAPGLYPELRVAETVMQAGFVDRLLGLVRFAVIVAIFTGCALGGLFMVALALSRPVGDWTLAAVRFAAIAAVMRLVTFINLGEHRQIEFMLESVLQAGLFVGLSIIALGIKPRTGLMLGGFTLMTFLAVWIASHLIVLATW